VVPRPEIFAAFLSIRVLIMVEVTGETMAGAVALATFYADAAASSRTRPWASEEHRSWSSPA
jgi:hypothetical protein